MYGEGEVGESLMVDRLGWGEFTSDGIVGRQWPSGRGDQVGAGVNCGHYQPTLLERQRVIAGASDEGHTGGIPTV